MMTLINYLLTFIEEDAPFGDITSDSIIGADMCEGVIASHQSGIVAGLDEADMLFSHFGVVVQKEFRDGDSIHDEPILMRLRGRARDILLVERTALNIIGRMSGIATATRACVDRVQRVDPTCRVACTRKTAPGLRMLDKKAVGLGGGDPHRLSLSDGILIKDNHLALVPVEEAIRRAKNSTIYRKIEVEVENMDAALLAVSSGADIIMLDNMPVERIVQIIRELEKRGVRKRVLIELSGGINEENIDRYAGIGADSISLGVLTHSVKNLDVSLEIIR
jgi:nicotinate-nucleotide pyrophosphorylase (carboxylating)